MNMKRWVLASFILEALVAVGLGAQSVTVLYLEGRVFAGSGDEWISVGIGDHVPLTGILRVQKESSIDLSAPGGRISLVEPGTYVLHDILQARDDPASADISAQVMGELKRILNGRSANQAVTGGVRGADEAKTADHDWVTSDAAVFVDAAKEYIASGNYDDALDQLDQVQASSDEESAEISFYRAEAYAMAGKTHQAYKILTSLAPKGKEAWAGDFILLKARLYLGSFAPRAAVDLLTDKASVALGNDSQYAGAYYFFLGLGYRGLGNVAQERQSLKRVVTISGDTGLGRTAGEILKGL
jgi:tetratricopeptide (TPR) repeat protein